jgi:hypothetical protein
VQTDAEAGGGQLGHGPLRTPNAPRPATGHPGLSATDRTRSISRPPSLALSGTDLDALEGVMAPSRGGVVVQRVSPSSVGPYRRRGCRGHQPGRGRARRLALRVIPPPTAARPATGRRRRPRPMKAQSISRRRGVAASGTLPACVARDFTTGEAVALTIFPACRSPPTIRSFASATNRPIAGNYSILPASTWSPAHLCRNAP